MTMMDRRLNRIRERNDCPKDIRIDVRLQTRGQYRGQIRLIVNPFMKFRQLKYKMLQDHRLPWNAQNWFYREQFPADDVTLAALGIREGSTLGLYIMLGKVEHFFPRPVEVQFPGGDWSMRSLRYVDAHCSLVALPVVRPAVPEQPPVLVQPCVPVQPPVLVQPCVPVQPPRVMWKCPQCTLDNEATRPGCEACGADRPEGFVVPANYQPSVEERRRLEHQETMDMMFQQAQEAKRLDHQQYIADNLNRIVLNDDLNYIVPENTFQCPICFNEIEPGEGIILRECLHEFCTVCLRGTIINNDEVQVICPFTNDDYECDKPLQDREILALVTKEEYDQFLARGLRIAEARAPDSFHCLTADCRGWCINEDGATTFQCPLCNQVNCIACATIHTGISCTQYQNNLRRAEINVEVRQTAEGIQTMLVNRQAMNCPGCGILLQKTTGCNHMKCTVCQRDFNWTGI